MWSRFFNSFAAGAPDALLGDVGGDGDTESIVSTSDLPATPSRHGYNQSVSSDVHPGDSASAINDEDSVLYGLKSSRGPESSLAPVGGSEEGTYLFKFLAPGGATHRFQSRYAGEEVYEHVVDIVVGKLSSDPFFEEGTDRDARDFKLNYLDDDGDLVLISTSKDIEDAVKVARKQGKDRVVLQLKGGKGWEHAMGAAKEAAQAKSLAAIQEDETEAGEKESTLSTQSKRSKSARPTSSAAGLSDEELLFGVLPKDLAVPAAIAFLGVTIIGVFTASRLTAR